MEPYWASSFPVSPSYISSPIFCPNHPSPIYCKRLMSFIYCTYIYFWIKLFSVSFFFFFDLQEADLVLGGDEGKECTYTNGYMKRQAIFSCLTCTPDGNAGVCTACSLSCHDGHEVFLIQQLIGLRIVQLHNFFFPE